MGLMKRWATFTLLLWIATIILVVASVGVGRSRSAPDAFSTPHIGLCNNIPCVQDVVPGVTTWDDATARFASITGSILTSGRLALGTSGLIQTTFNSDARGDKVDTINVSFAVPSLTLGTLFTQFGMPCKVRTYASGGVQVIYPRLTANLDMVADVSHSVARLSSDVVINEMNFPAETNTCSLEVADPANLYHDQLWRGFVALDDYQN